MKTITEDYVSFEIAKLLKEKGFNEPCHALVYRKDKDKIFFGLDVDSYYNAILNMDCYACPTLQMAMKWLREVHNLQIQIAPITSGHKNWTFGIDRDFSPLTIKLLCLPTYENAAEAAIKYCLENLI